MESQFWEQRDILIDDLRQIPNGILSLLEWNKDVTDLDALMKTPGGMQDVAGSCMLLLAICEGFKKIDKLTEGSFLPMRKEIPWRAVFGLRNRIAHGYFDIDIEVVSEVIKSYLQPLLEATIYFILYLTQDSFKICHK